MLELEWAQSSHEARGKICHLKLGSSSFDFTVGLALNSSSGPSEIILQGETGTRLRPSKMARAKRALQSSRPLFTILGSGGGKITLLNLFFEGFDGAPAIQALGGERIAIEDCNFSSNAGSGVVVYPEAVVVIRSCRFTRNGDAMTSRGGAIRVDGGSLQLIDSTFDRNEALEGGAMYIRGGASVAVLNSLFRRNHANSTGGALVVVDARVVLGNGTLLEGNHAEEANTLGVTPVLDPGRQVVTYVLPAPLAHWIANVVECGPADSWCFTEYGRFFSRLTSASVNVDYPYVCPPGLFGNSTQPPHQSSPQCSGSCPAGKFCSGATVWPQVCEKGTFCNQGSPAPTPCRPGTHGLRPQLTSQGQCTDCALGYFCRGGTQIECARGTYNNLSLANESAACIRCPGQSTTLLYGSTSISECICDINHYDRQVTASNASSGPDCQPCMTGTNCSEDLVGITVRTLPIRQGFWRASELSTDVRRCADAEANCTSSTLGDECWTSSGCFGGRDLNKTCRPGLMGPFCELCIQTAGSIRYHEPASQDAVAGCEVCEDTLPTTIAVAAGITAVLLLSIALACLLSRWGCVKRAYVRLRSVVKLKTTDVVSKIKISIGFYMICCKVSNVYQIDLPPFVDHVLVFLDRVLSLGIDRLLTPLECIAIGEHTLGGYFPTLIAWMALPPVLTAVLFLTIVVWTRASGKRDYAVRFVSCGMQLLFILYPVITTIAFEAFACHRVQLGESGGFGTWLIADVAIDCTSDLYSTVRLVAFIALALYPVGAIVFCSVLLYMAHDAIMFPEASAYRARRWLAHGLQFLHRDLKPEFMYWEVVEMFRRFVLVGVFVVVQPGTLLQIVLATVFSGAYLLIQMHTRPYASNVDQLFAAGNSFLLLLTFTFCMGFKYNSLIEFERLSEEQHEILNLDSTMLGVGLIITAISTLPICAIVLVYEMESERRRLRREAQSVANRRLRYASSDKEVEPPSIQEGRFHLFLSHVWGTGQDQCRIIKQRLLELMPMVKVFLDVDDLKEGKGAEYVDRSHLILIYCSKGYFDSPNCMRELLRAFFQKKPILTLLDPEAKHGGMTTKEVLEAINRADAYYDAWGLAAEMAEWGMPHQSPDYLFNFLFAEDSVEWNRIGVYQDVTLRVIAKRLISSVDVSSHRGQLKKPNTKAVYVQGEMTNQRPALLEPTAKHHVFTSSNNPGARELMHELAERLGMEVVVNGEESSNLLDVRKRRRSYNLNRLLVTTHIGELRECDHMLLYLTSETWTRAEPPGPDCGSSLLAEEVRQAMDAGVHLQLAHEMLGMGQDGRHACEFGDFFRCDRGTTPGFLLGRNIYGEIAVGLKGGEWRQTSMVLLAQAFSTGQASISPRVDRWWLMRREGSVEKLGRVLTRSRSISSRHLPNAPPADKDTNVQGTHSESVSNEQTKEGILGILKSVDSVVTCASSGRVDNQEARAASQIEAAPAASQPSVPNQAQPPLCVRALSRIPTRRGSFSRIPTRRGSVKDDSVGPRTDRHIAARLARARADRLRKRFTMADSATESSTLPSSPLPFTIARSSAGSFSSLQHSAESRQDNAQWEGARSSANPSPSSGAAFSSTLSERPAMWQWNPKTKQLEAQEPRCVDSMSNRSLPPQAQVRDMQLPGRLHSPSSPTSPRSSSPEAFARPSRTPSLSPTKILRRVAQRPRAAKQASKSSPSEGQSVDLSRIKIKELEWPSNKGFASSSEAASEAIVRQATVEVNEVLRARSRARLADIPAGHPPS